MRNEPNYMSPPPIDPLSPDPAMSQPPQPAQPGMPETQPTQPTQPIQPAQPTQQPIPTTPGVPPQPGANPNVPLPNSDKQKTINLIRIIAIIVLSVIAATFIGLFIWKYVEWDAAKTDVNSQIEKAVSNAISEKTTEMENDFAEREKYPYDTFTAPDDYGGLSFEYPKTWSVYIAKSAEENKGDYEAYFNPGEVQPISATTINATRVTIKSQTFEKTIAEYDKLVEKGKMSVEVRTLNNEKYPEVKGDTYNLYRGELPSKLRGAVAIFKVLDKSYIIQTDAEVFMGAGDQGDFFRPVLETVHYFKPKLGVDT